MGENSEDHLWISLENKHTVSPLYCAKSIVNILNSPLCITFSQSWYRHFLTKVSFRIFQIHNFVTLKHLIMWKVLREKCPNMECLLACIFPYLDWIRRLTEYISVFSPNAGKYGPEKTPYLDTFHAVIVLHEN